MSTGYAKYPLLVNGGATGNPVDWPGGDGIFYVASGTFGGATVKLQWAPDEINYQDVDRSGDTFCTLTTVGSGFFTLPVCKIRAAVVGGSPSGINAAVESV